MAHNKSNQADSFMLPSPDRRGAGGEAAYLDRFQIIIASYFKYWGEEVAEMLTSFEEIDQRRITQAFMDIIEGGHYMSDDDKVIRITTHVARDIRKVVEGFMKLYELDRMAEQTLKEAKERLSVPIR